MDSENLGAVERNVYMNLYGVVWAKQRPCKVLKRNVSTGQWCGNWRDLAKLTGHSEKQVRLAVSKLIKRKWLEKDNVRDAKNRERLLITVTNYEFLSNARCYFKSQGEGRERAANESHKHPAYQELRERKEGGGQHEGRKRASVINKEYKTLAKGTCGYCDGSGKTVNGKPCPNCGVERQ